ncbi:hypothetical protein SETIT_1G264600v2 [Setaria italica]|uniref:DUF1618 domain-containing protein n=1 Tax=Setaria italica TaxID=4555 RepID=A0A368PPW2_SETIT|nr:hypothetical protein SETIT_1G264600v2 [Setaria italica]
MASVQARSRGGSRGRRGYGGNLPPRASSSRSYRPPPPPPSLPPWVVLDPYVDLEDTAPPVKGEAWAMVDCASRKAYGCGEHGQKPISDLSTALYIQANGDARQGLRAEFGEGDDGPPIHIDGDDLYAKGFVEASDENRIVLTVDFRLHYISRRTYYLIYDAADMSLSMIPCAPDDEHPIAASSTLKPLPLRRDDGGYDLAVLAKRRVPPVEEEGFSTLEDILCVWTPEAKEEQPWRVHLRRYPAEVQHPFSAEVMFAFEGKAFLVDLSLGLLYCNLPAATDGSVVELHFIPLPQAIPVDLKCDKTKPEDMGALYPDRTMGCVGGSIKFLCIDRTPPRKYGDAELTVWTLDPNLSKKHWQKDTGFPPKCPVLMRDGTLCLLLPNKRRKTWHSMADFIFNLDPYSTPLDLRWSGRIRGYRYDPPFMLPSDFFKKLVVPFPMKGGIVM